MLQLVLKARPGADYIKCPAVVDRLKNTFAIKSPFDFAVDVDEKNNAISTDRFGKKFFDDHVRLRNVGNGRPILMTLPPAYLFYAHEPVIMELQDLPIILSSASQNTKVVVGEYNIGSWVRPIDWTFELHNQSFIKINRGDALFAVRFRPSNNRPIKLVRKDLTKDLMSKMYGCLQVKRYVNNLNLPALYEMATQYLSSIIKNK